MKGRICSALHTSGMRCWRRDHDDGEHFAVRPNHDSNINQHPVITTWQDGGSENAVQN